MVSPPVYAWVGITLLAARHLETQTQNENLPDELDRTPAFERVDMLSD